MFPNAKEAWHLTYLDDEKLPGFLSLWGISGKVEIVVYGLYTKVNGQMLERT